MKQMDIYLESVPDRSKTFLIRTDMDVLAHLFIIGTSSLFVELGHNDPMNDKQIRVQFGRSRQFLARVARDKMYINRLKPEDLNA